MSTNPRARAWIEVDADALRANLRTIGASAGPDARLIPMVKADAYGLGMAEAVRAFEPTNPWGFGIATVEEGVGLRELGVVRPVVVFSPVPPDAVEAAVAADLEVGVSDPSTLDLLVGAGRRQGRAAKFHIEIDTGIGRAGLDWREADRWAPAVRNAAASGAMWLGCYTHMHSADENAESVHEQWSRFSEALAVLAPPDGVPIHAMNSAGSLRTPEYAAGAVRPGIFLFGGCVGDGMPAPSPVASLYARVVHVRQARAGDTLGYGSTYVASGAERWATLAIGYGDGFPRALSNRGHAIVDGRMAPIIGRISMDVTVVHITAEARVGAGDIATLMGTDGDLRITVDDVAEQAGTISYEVLTGLTRRLPRIWSGIG